MGLEIGRYRRLANDWDLFAIDRSCSNTNKDEVDESFFDFDGFIASGNCEDDARSYPFKELQHVYLPSTGRISTTGAPFLLPSRRILGWGSENKRYPAEYQVLQEKQELLQRQFKWGKGEGNGAGSRRKIPYQSQEKEGRVGQGL